METRRFLRWRIINAKDERRSGLITNLNDTKRRKVRLNSMVNIGEKEKVIDDNFWR